MSYQVGECLTCGETYQPSHDHQCPRFVFIPPPPGHNIIWLAQMKDRKTGRTFTVERDEELLNLMNELYK